MHTQKCSETHPQLNLTYATFVDIHRLHTMCHAWNASHILLKPIKCSDRRIWVQPSVGPQCKPSMCATWMRPLSVITVDPRPLCSPQPHPESIFLSCFLPTFNVFSLYFSVVPTTSPPRQQSPQQCGTVALPAPACFMWPRRQKNNRSRICKQERSCPVMCVWLSVCHRKQAKEMWMWSALPDWLKVCSLQDISPHSRWFIDVVQWATRPQAEGERVSKTKVLLNVLEEIHTYFSIKSFRPPGSPHTHKLQFRNSDIKYCKSQKTLSIVLFLYLKTAHTQILPVLEKALLAPWEMGLRADVLLNKKRFLIPRALFEVVILRNLSRAKRDSPHLALSPPAVCSSQSFWVGSCFALAAAAAIHRGGKVITKTEPKWFWADPFLFRHVIHPHPHLPHHSSVPLLHSHTETISALE